MRTKIVLPLLFATVLLGCLPLRRPGETVLNPKGVPPQILGYYAEKEIRPGRIWKVFLKIWDADCDMSYIITDIWQPGVGPYPVSFTPVAVAGCDIVVGYLSLPTPMDANLVGDRLEVKIAVRDEQGNHSESLKLPLLFAWNAKEELPAEWHKAAAHSLGRINVALKSPESVGNR
ncbi:MAG: hypothetical protein JRJ12_11835 [Deltaproteobacteria bacterium]|nr:hypothetical protein [Deltaproteobacteria bacterium]MBW2071205.1 hypothetical protein [Deltaproteobacteria bacterium]